MALNDLLKKIQDEVSKKAAFMKQVTDDEIKKIGEEANQKAQDRQKEIEEKTQEKQQSVIEKVKILAKMESKSLLLKEKREVIGMVYKEAEKELDNLDHKAYVSLLAQMFQHAANSLPKGHLMIPVDRKSQTEEAIQKAKVDYQIKEETHDFKGGFILTEGKIELNMSFSYLIQKVIHPSTELEVAKILFT